MNRTLRQLRRVRYCVPYGLRGTADPWHPSWPVGGDGHWIGHGNDAASQRTSADSPQAGNPQ